MPQISYIDQARAYLAEVRREPYCDAAYIDETIRAGTLKDRFAAEFDVQECVWSDYNLARLVNQTGAARPRIKQMRAIILELAGTHPGCGATISCRGAFDHNDFWSRSSGRGGQKISRPVMMVGSPYEISDREHALLAELAQFGPIAVAVDDRPSYYGFGSHHVRIALRLAI